MPNSAEVKKSRSAAPRNNVSEFEQRDMTPKISEGSVFFSTSADFPLAQRVLRLLRAEPGKLLIEKFPNGESRIELQESVRDKHVFVLAANGSVVNEAVIETGLVVQAAKLSDAKKITVLLPYFPYSRQDRRTDARSPISAKLVTSLLKSMGADGLISIDLHSNQVEGFFDGPFDNLSGLNQIVPWLIKDEGNALTVFSPDVGGSKRAESFARSIEKITEEFVPLVIMSKFRKGPDVPPIVTLSADPSAYEGRTCILVDDMIDTGGSILAAAIALKEKGAKRVVVCSSHGILSKNAEEKLRGKVILQSGEIVQPVDSIYITDTLNNVKGDDGFIKVVSVAPLLATAVKRLNTPLGTLSDIKYRVDLGVPLWRQN